MIDGAIRRLNQMDATIFSSGHPARWRHFLESDFAMNSLAGYNPELILTVYNQFVNVDYSVPSCQMLIIPVLVDTIWCAYMFDTYFSELHILDPAHSTERYKLPQQLHPILDDSLRKCLTSFYQGWSLEPLDQWKMKYPQLGPVFNSDDCGTIMLHYARNYNGMYLDEPLNEENIAHAGHSLMLEILYLEGNTAALPQAVAEIFLS